MSPKPAEAQSVVALPLHHPVSHNKTHSLWPIVCFELSVATPSSWSLAPGLSAINPAFLSSLNPPPPAATTIAPHNPACLTVLHLLTQRACPFWNKTIDFTIPFHASHTCKMKPFRRRMLSP